MFNFKKIKQWLDEPVGGWDKYWDRKVKSYSKEGMNAIKKAVECYMLKWSIYYHNSEEYDTSYALSLEAEITRFLENSAMNHAQVEE